MSKVACFISEYEELNRKFLEDYTCHAVTQEMSRDALKVRMPKEVEKAVNLAFFGRSPESITYEVLKEAVLASIPKQNDSSAPMDVG